MGGLVGPLRGPLRNDGGPQTPPPGLRGTPQSAPPTSASRGDHLPHPPRRGAGRPAAHVGTNIDLERALKQLTGTARAVVWLHDVEGYTHEEIAELMGKTVSFSKSQLARAHARLRRTLEPGLEGA